MSTQTQTSKRPLKPTSYEKARRIRKLQVIMNRSRIARCGIQSHASRREGGGEGWQAAVRSAQASFTSTRFPLRRISWLARHAGCGHTIETYRELFEPLSLMNEMLKIRPHASHGRWTRASARFSMFEAYTFVGGIVQGNAARSIKAARLVARGNVPKNPH